MVKLPKKLLIIKISLFLFSFASNSQILSKQDSINFKNDLEKLLTKYGLKDVGYQINVQSNNQRGGQTAFIINNNYFTSKKREVSDSLLNSIIKELPDMNFPIRIYMRNKDGESFGFCEKIKNALNKKGYNNVSISTANRQSSRFTGDPQADLEFEKSISITIEKESLSSPSYNYLQIIIPTYTEN